MVSDCVGAVAMLLNFSVGGSVIAEVFEILPTLLVWVFWRLMVSRWSLVVLCCAAVVAGIDAVVVLARSMVRVVRVVDGAVKWKLG